MSDDNLQMTLTICLRETHRVFYEFLLRDLDRTLRALDRAAMSNSRSTARRDVEHARRMLADIERYLNTLDFESSQQEAISKRRVALVARLRLLV
jgi:hypothetical protein